MLLLLSYYTPILMLYLYTLILVNLTNPCPFQKTYTSQGSKKRKQSTHIPTKISNSFSLLSVHIYMNREKTEFPLQG